MIASECWRETDSTACVNLECQLIVLGDETEREEELTRLFDVLLGLLELVVVHLMLLILLRGCLVVPQSK